MICLPQSVEEEELLHNIREISWNVSRILKSYSENNENNNQFKRKLQINYSETGPITLADTEISEYIKSAINQKYNLINWEFLSEEDKKYNKNRKFESKWVWIIDPLDGTKDFINKTGEYAMHLALTYQKKIILGIVLIPSKNELWLFLKGRGTWCEKQDFSENLLIKNNFKDISEITVLTSRTHVTNEFRFLLEKLNPKKIIGMGSIGYKVTSILRGDGDLYISYAIPGGSCPKDWDIASPLSLIEGAGGYFTDINGRSLNFLKDENYDQRGILISSINSNHKEICKTISNIVKNIN